MNCGTPGLPVHHQRPEFTQTHVPWVGDAIQPSYPLSSPSPPAPSPVQHWSLFQWVNASQEVAKVLEFQLHHQSFQWTPRTGLNIDNEILTRWNICASQITAMLWKKLCNWYILFFIILKTEILCCGDCIYYFYKHSVFKTSLIQRYNGSNEHTVHKQVPLGFFALPSMFFCGDDCESLNVLSPC